MIDDLSSCPPTKYCSKCQRFLPANAQHFSRDRSKKDGLRTLCKGCESRRKPLEHPVPEGMKRCSKCKNDLPATPEFFDRDKHTKDGLYPYCKVCRKPMQKVQNAARYRQSDKQKNRDRMRNYRKTEKWQQYIKDYRARHYQEHKDELLERQKQYYQENQEEINARRRQHRKDTPDLYQVTDRTHKHKRKAQKFAAGGSYTGQQLQEQHQRQKGRCYYCKRKLGDRWHADHIVPLSRGGSNDISNIVVTCPTCNMRKNDKLPHEWPLGGRLL